MKHNSAAVCACVFVCVGVREMSDSSAKTCSDKLCILILLSHVVFHYYVLCCASRCAC